MATPTYGTLALLDELSVIDKDNVFTYGEDRLFQSLRDLLEVHNLMVQDMIGQFVEFTSDNIRRFGAGYTTGEMLEIDEFGLTDVQKTSMSGYDIGFPLKRYQYSMGWTRAYFETKSVADITKEFVAAQDADVNNIRRQILNALLLSSNYTFVDRWVNSQSLPVKRLINADSTAIPMNRYGSTFNGATHTHYIARVSTLAASDIDAAINTVLEHDLRGGTIEVLINVAQESAIRAFTSIFTPLQAPLLNPGGGSTADVPLAPRDTPYQLDNRPIGIWDGYVMVSTKNWVPANYIIVVVNNSPVGKVLTFRRRNVNGYGNFRMVAEHEHYPLRAQHFEREFGLGVWNRFGAAVLYTGGTSYTNPTIT